MVELRLEHVTKIFAPAQRALDDVSLTVRPGECLALLGPSGCGKTTLLRLVAGLEQATQGHLHIGGRCVDHVPGHQRGVAMLFQRPALIPGGTVRQNMLWGRILREPWNFVKRLFGEDKTHEPDLRQLTRMLDLENVLDRAVGQLSGGQQQRVALGRCLLRRAPVCLLDEPLGHLDAPLRIELRRQIRRLAQENGTTLIVVTHDPAEALAFGDRVAVMQQGRIVQVDEPAQLQRRPAHRRVAEMMHYNRGGMSFLTGRVDVNAGAWWFTGTGGRWRLPSPDSPGKAIFLQDPKKLLSHDDPGYIIIIGVAAENVVCSYEGSPACDGDVQITLPAAQQEYAAGGWWVIADGSERLIGHAADAGRIRSGQDVTMMFSIEQTYGFDPLTGSTVWMPSG